MEIGLEDKCFKYPQLKKINANSYYLGLVQNLFAGTEGELTCFLQITFQTYILCDEHMEVFRKIARQDLKHMEMLSQIIKALGGVPQFYNAQKKWWNAREVDYVQSFRQMVSLDIECKEKSVIDYKSTIQKIASIDLNAILQRILSDEINHLQTLKNIYAKL